MYWRIIVLQDTYKKYMGIESKCATRKAQQKQIKREAHIPCKFGPTTNETTLWAHPGSNHAKAVASGASPGVATPRLRLHCPHLLSGPPLIGGALLTRIGAFAWYLQGICPQTALGTSIIGGGEPPLSTPHLEPLHLRPPHLYSFTL